MVKTLNFFLLWNQKADNLESMRRQVSSNNDPGLTLTYFTARSDLVPYAFVLEKGKTMAFSETIVVNDIKVRRCSQLNEYMNLYEYQWSRSFVDVRRRSLRFNIFKLLSLRKR